MVKIRHLVNTEYVVYVSQRLPQVIANGTIYLEKTKDFSNLNEYELDIDVKFNSSTMNGMLISAGIKRNDKEHSSAISSILVYRINDGDWTSTLVYTSTPTQSGTRWNSSITQANLGSNELSGAETYKITIEAQRRTRKYRKSVYVNHLGVFDSLTRARHAIEQLTVNKLDE